MKHIDLKYGKECLHLAIPEENLIGVIQGNFPISPTEKDEFTELKRAVENPIGSKPLRTMGFPECKTVIMCSDQTRPCPSYKLLPILLDELSAAGINDNNITVMFGMGIHRPLTAKEHEQIVGSEIYKRVKCVDSTVGEYSLVGNSSCGTPYYVNKLVADCDLLICTGNIDYHYFVGYSGGAKAILPGASNKETISYNHSMQLLSGAKQGVLDGNPVRADIDEITKFVRVDFLLNVVLDEKKNILRAFAGDCIKAHREGCRYLDKVYSKPIDKFADVVIACSGGYPKDINMYQAQKALENGHYAVKEGGKIIWIGSCPEGYGEETFESWVNESTSLDSILERIKYDFVLGGHKAAAISRVLKRAEVEMVTDMNKKLVERLYIKHHRKNQLQAVVDKIIQESNGNATFYIIPQAGSVFPRYK